MQSRKSYGFPRLFLLLVRFLLLLAGQQAAGGHYVLASRGANGAGYAVAGQVVAEGVHCLWVAGAVGCAGRGVEAYEVDAASQPSQQACQLGGVKFDEAMQKLKQAIDQILDL